MGRHIDPHIRSYQINSWDYTKKGWLEPSASDQKYSKSLVSPTLFHRGREHVENAVDSLEEYKIGSTDESVAYLSVSP